MSALSDAINQTFDAIQFIQRYKCRDWFTVEELLKVRDFQRCTTESHIHKFIKHWKRYKIVPSRLSNRVHNCRNALRVFASVLLKNDLDGLRLVESRHFKDVWSFTDANNS
jgi:hypothetical protein